MLPSVYWKGPSVYSFLFFEQLRYLFLLGTHGCYNSYFHNSTLFMAANVRILSEYIVSLQR